MFFAYHFRGVPMNFQIIQYVIKELHRIGAVVPKGITSKLRDSLVDFQDEFFYFFKEKIFFKEIIDGIVESNATIKEELNEVTEDDSAEVGETIGKTIGVIDGDVFRVEKQHQEQAYLSDDDISENASIAASPTLFSDAPEGNTLHVSFIKSENTTDILLEKPVSTLHYDMPMFDNQKDEPNKVNEPKLQSDPIIDLPENNEIIEKIEPVKVEQGRKLDIPLQDHLELLDRISLINRAQKNELNANLTEEILPKIEIVQLDEPKLQSDPIIELPENNEKIEPVKVEKGEKLDVPLQDHLELLDRISMINRAQKDQLNANLTEEPLPKIGVAQLMELTEYQLKDRTPKVEKAQLRELTEPVKHYAKIEFPIQNHLEVLGSADALNEIGQLMDLDLNVQEYPLVALEMPKMDTAQLINLAEPEKDFANVEVLKLIEFTPEAAVLHNMPMYEVPKLIEFGPEVAILVDPQLDLEATTPIRIEHTESAIDNIPVIPSLVVENVATDDILVAPLLTATDVAENSAIEDIPVAPPLNVIDVAENTAIENIPVAPALNVTDVAENTVIENIPVAPPLNIADDAAIIPVAPPLPLASELIESDFVPAVHENSQAKVHAAPSVPHKIANGKPEFAFTGYDFAERLNQMKLKAAEKRKMEAELETNKAKVPENNGNPFFGKGLIQKMKALKLKLADDSNEDDSEWSDGEEELQPVKPLPAAIEKPVFAEKPVFVEKPAVLAEKPVQMTQNKADQELDQARALAEEVWQNTLKDQMNLRRGVVVDEDDGDDFQGYDSDKEVDPVKHLLAELYPANNSIPGLDQAPASVQQISLVNQGLEHGGIVCQSVLVPHLEPAVGTAEVPVFG